MSIKTSQTTNNKNGMHHVNFSNNDGDHKVNPDRKKRYLTAKYGQHQMNLIKKRLKVEMWMYEQLQFLFDSVFVVSRKFSQTNLINSNLFFILSINIHSLHNEKDEDEDLTNIDIDLDEVLDLDEIKERKQWLRVCCLITLDPEGIL